MVIETIIKINHDTGLAIYRDGDKKIFVPVLEKEKKPLFCRTNDF